MNTTFILKLLSQQRDKLIDVAREMHELETLFNTFETYIECEEIEKIDT